VTLVFRRRTQIFLLTYLLTYYQNFYRTLYCKLKQQYPYYQEILQMAPKVPIKFVQFVFLSSKLAFCTHTTSIFTAELLAIQLAVGTIQYNVKKTSVEV